MTEEETKAAEAIAQATALEEANKNLAIDDSEEKILALEKEKQELLVREANYKVAYLKEKKKNEEIDPEESDEERIRRITREELSNNRLQAIDSEKEALFKKTLKENKELKLAIQNKPTNTSTGGGASTEQPLVTSTVVTSEQLAAFKAKGWTEKDIERYKKNLSRFK